MSWMRPEQRRFAEVIASLSEANPFTDRRISLEREALGSAFVDVGAVWSAGPEAIPNNPNLDAIEAKARELVESLHAVSSRAPPAIADQRLYADLARFALYARHSERLFRWWHTGRGDVGALYRAFRADHDRLFDVRGLPPPPEGEAAHLFALFFQLRRAFHHVFTQVLGPSAVSANLRVEIWRSIFTRDMNRYRRGLYGAMREMPTLILGPSGTGKELVARAIGLSGYLTFDDKRGAFEEPAPEVHAVNVAALSPTLVEAELFGHRKGAFTGATEGRAGWLETCARTGAVFLDEIGDLAPEVQVKLLRVAQERTLSRVGETSTRPFAGKLIAATHRDLAARMRDGRFREDLYYRLCGDLVTTPSLKARIDDDVGELAVLVGFLARRLVDEESVAEEVTDEVLAFIESELGFAYPWPGNVRELEQCVRNVLVRGHYTPPTGGHGAPAQDPLTTLMAEQLSADELLGRYCRRVYQEVGSYEEAGKRLGLDRRTVKKHVESGV